eukprot:TRINITY_DN20952_c0_g1_i4.p1 TRINITY_DN20952_c0_g1~~TRINITY_DN20952_c0_g1_i4.p1  ORF type:complete len:995 (+),score=163.73 TRINITY_DN20952_c0_g1_i4:2428-5412(+)
MLAEEARVAEEARLAEEEPLAEEENLGTAQLAEEVQFAEEEQLSEEARFTEAEIPDEISEELYAQHTEEPVDRYSVTREIEDDQVADDFVFEDNNRLTDENIETETDRESESSDIPNDDEPEGGLFYSKPQKDLSHLLGTPFRLIKRHETHDYGQQDTEWISDESGLAYLLEVDTEELLIVAGVGEGNSGTSTLLNAIGKIISEDDDDLLNGFPVTESSSRGKPRSSTGVWGMLVQSKENNNQLVLLLDIRSIVSFGNVADDAGLLAALYPIIGNLIVTSWASDEVHETLDTLAITTAIGQSIIGSSVAAIGDAPVPTVSGSGRRSKLSDSSSLTPAKRDLSMVNLESLSDIFDQPSCILAQMGVSIPLDDISAHYHLKSMYKDISTIGIPPPSLNHSILHDLSYYGLSELNPGYSQSIMDMLDTVFRKFNSRRTPSETGATVAKTIDRIVKETRFSKERFPKVPRIIDAYIGASTLEFKTQVLSWVKTIMSVCSKHAEKCTISDTAIGLPEVESDAAIHVVLSVESSSSFDGILSGHPPSSTSIHIILNTVVRIASILFSKMTKESSLTGIHLFTEELNELQSINLNTWEKAVDAHISELADPAAEIIKQRIDDELDSLHYFCNDSVVEGVVDDSLRLFFTEVIDLLGKRYHSSTVFNKSITALNSTVSQRITEHLITAVALTKQNRAERSQEISDSLLRSLQVRLRLNRPQSDDNSHGYLRELVLDDFLQQEKDVLSLKWTVQTSEIQDTEEAVNELASLQSSFDEAAKSYTHDNNALITRFLEASTLNRSEAFVAEMIGSRENTMPGEQLRKIMESAISKCVEETKEYLLQRLEPVSERLQSEIDAIVGKLHELLSSTVSTHIVPAAQMRWENAMSSVFNCASNKPFNTTTWKLAVSQPHVRKHLRLHAEDCFHDLYSDIPLSRALSDIRHWSETSPTVVQIAWIDNSAFRGIQAAVVFIILLVLSLSPLLWEDFLGWDEIPSTRLPPSVK